MSLYCLARNICAANVADEPDGHQPPGMERGFCEPCLVEAMGRWDGVARLIAEAVARADRAEAELASVGQIVRHLAPRGCLPPGDDVRASSLAMHALSALRRALEATRAWTPAVGRWCLVRGSDPMVGGRVAQIVAADELGHSWRVRVSHGEHGTTDHDVESERLGPPPDDWLLRDS